MMRGETPRLLESPISSASNTHESAQRPVLSTWTELPPTWRAAAAASLSGVVDTRALDVVLVETWLILHQLALEGMVSARVKAPHSVAAKAKRKSIRPEAVLDRLALRIRLEDAGACYAVFDRICARWNPIPDSLDDYILHPKPNGYQSLHVAVQTVFGAVEFQVRTHVMHQHAELGGAAHRTYKLQQAPTASPLSQSAHAVPALGVHRSTTSTSR